MLPRRIFSGIQPTGVPHLGNYLGAIKHWVQLQGTAKQKEEVVFCVVDLHSCTTCRDVNTMKNNIFDMVASLLACGIDANRSVICQQSQVPYHSELAWYLGCLTNTGQLKRMHHWKSKKDEKKADSNLGLFSYPVLMAADILLFRSTHIPVGEDQIQHIELTRDIAETFNKVYAYDFPLPTAIQTNFSRVMGLRNPSVKMSKSNPDENSRINISDHPDIVARKINKALTDSEPYITEELDNRPGVRNLVGIYSACSNKSTADILDRYENVKYFTRDLKKDLSEVVIETLKPIRSEFLRLSGDRAHLEHVLRDGSALAQTMAVKTMSDIHRKIGLR